MHSPYFDVFSLFCVRQYSIGDPCTTMKLSEQCCWHRRWLSA